MSRGCSYTNQLLIRTCGDRADFGTITATDEEFFFPWKDIYPEKYRKFTPPLGQVRQQETLIQGMLPKETLLDLIRTCTVFMDVGQGPGQSDGSLSAVSGRLQDHRPAAKRRDAGRTVGRHLAHSGIGKIADDGVCDPQAAHVR